MKNDRIRFILRFGGAALCLAAIIILAFPVVVLNEGCGPELSGCVANRYSAFDLSKVGAVGIECFWIPYWLIVCLPFLLCGALLRPLAWKIVGVAFSAFLLLPAVVLLVEPDHLALDAPAALSVSAILIAAFCAYAGAGVWQLVGKLVSDSSHRSA
jgi:hypothetical protein